MQNNNNAFVTDISVIQKLKLSHTTIQYITDEQIESETPVCKPLQIVQKTKQNPELNVYQLVNLIPSHYGKNVTL